ncbi:MAG: hypothetical protein AAFX06_09575 [Planctomycetota bacterium]
MTEQGYRSVGAITGLVVGLALMRVVGQGGLVATFCFGAGGAVVGGMLGERIHDQRGGK